MEVLVLSLDRSGTISLTEMLNNLFQVNGLPRGAQHETDDPDLHLAIRDARRTGDNQDIRAILSTWTHSAEVTTVLGFCMDQVFEHFGPRQKIIHLKRDRETCIHSLMNSARLHPYSYVGYTQVPPEMRVRDCITAVDFGEMSNDEWNALSLRARWGWYYDKAHGEIERHLGKFGSTLSIATEDLNSDDAKAAIGALINPLWRTAIPTSHVNRTDVIDLDKIPAEGRIYIDTVFKYIDWNQAATSVPYLSSFFLQRMLSLYAMQPDTAPEMEATLDNYMNAIRSVKKT